MFLEYGKETVLISRVSHIKIKNKKRDFLMFKYYESSCQLAISIAKISVKKTCIIVMIPYLMNVQQK